MAPKRKANGANNDGRPIKKSKSTTAGRGAEGESNAPTNGRTDNSQSVSPLKLPTCPDSFIFVFASFLPSTITTNRLCQVRRHDIFAPVSKLTMIPRMGTQMSVQLAVVTVYFSAVKVAHVPSTLLASTLPSIVRREAYGTATDALKIAMHCHLHPLGSTEPYSAIQIGKTQPLIVFLPHSETISMELKPAKMASTRRRAS